MRTARKTRQEAPDWGGKMDGQNNNWEEGAGVVRVRLGASKMTEPRMMGNRGLKA